MIIQSYWQKNKLNTIKVLISKTLVDSYIYHEYFFSKNNVLRKQNKVKEEIQNTKDAVKYTI